MNQLDVKAVFFDFDDTLQSRKGAYRLYCEDFLTKYFPGISKEEREKKLDEMEEHVDGGYKDREVYFPEMIALWHWDNHPPLEELYDSFNNDFGKHVVLLDGAVDVLKKLKEKGYILGAVTNGVSSLQNTKLDTAGIRELFDVVVVSGDIGIYKPDRRIFDEAARRAGVENEKVLFVGDHPVNDIKGALGAGMKAIRMNYGDFKGKGLGEKGVVAEIVDIRQVLDYV
ncbi:MAG: HAD family hydrolase [Acutalibacteraceae bacterium]